MSSKLPKRSILGTRVSAPWSDGLYYGGVIDSCTEQPNGQVMYTVGFEDGYTRSYFSSDIIGPGFSSICNTKLKYKQKVYLTRSGREVKGFVTKHSKLTDEVFIELPSPEGPIDITRKIDEVRLLESRKSPRLQEGDDQDFSKVQAGEPTRKRKGLDIPTRKARNSSGDEVPMTTVEHMAALALTSLSCSPQSPGFQDRDGYSPQPWSGSNAFGVTPPSPHSAVNLSASAPVGFASRSVDEGIDVDMGSLSMRERGPIHYQCTWKGCGHVATGQNHIELHVRSAHLGPKSVDNSAFNEEEFYYTPIGHDEGADNSDDLAPCSPPKRHSSSSPHPGSVAGGPMKIRASPAAAASRGFSFGMGAPPVTSDHDYLRKDAPIMATSSSTGPQKSVSVPSKLSSPITIPKVGSTQHFFAMKSVPSYARQGKPSPGSPAVSATGPKSPSAAAASGAFVAARKSRSDVKKCRKVYGMEHHDKWCTQCRWKKACTRFPNE